MTRLQNEWQRLYAPGPAAEPVPESDNRPLVDAGGRVRAMVLGLARPADWQVLSTVWQGVQADLGWPAPAIAVNGIDAIQLWFSLAAPVPAPQASALLQALRQHYLADMPAHRLALLPAHDPTAPGQVQHGAPVPAEQANSSRWSAFVAPDLAAMFADEPWLDLCPNPDGQAKLLAGLASTPLADLPQALQRLRPEAGPSPAQLATGAAVAAGTEGASQRPAHPEPATGPAPAAPTAAVAASAAGGPKQFLLDVLHNEAVPLTLRIEAAKALLPYLERPVPP